MSRTLLHRVHCFRLLSFRKPRKTLNVSDRLLPLLSALPQTGDALGEQLGVGRVTVHTLARRLADQGVPIIVSRQGYALEPGTPAPGLVPVHGVFGRALRYTGTTTSTQDDLRLWAEHPTSPAPHGAVVVAERQTAGRGRRGRAWDTPQDTLVFSVLLCAPLTLPDLALMPLAAGVAVHEACRTGGLKWPNDLLTLDGRKLAGILLEADLRGEEARRAVLGIGVNVGSAPPGAAHLHETQPGLTRAELLGRLLGALEHWLVQPAEDVLSAWRAASLTLGQAVHVNTPRGTVQGTAIDLDTHGNLQVQDPDGQVHTISAGDVQLIGSLPLSSPPNS